METINVFLAISKYPYNPEHDPQENQHTAFFAYILNSNRKLLKYMLQKVLSKSKLLKDVKEDDFTIRIQESEILEGEVKRPDMVIKTIADNLAIYVENKIESIEREGQLNDYLELAKRNSSEEKFVIYITKHYEDINQDIDEHPNFGGQFTWGMISDFIEEYINQSNSNSEKYDFERQFLEYMEVHGLSGTKGFKKEYGEIWNTFNEFKEIRDEYLGYIENYFENKGYAVKKENRDGYKIITIYKPNWSSKDLDGFWINIGFELDFERQPESESPPIVLITQLGCRKKFFEDLKRELSKDLKTAMNDLEKINFLKIEWEDPIIIDGYITLKEMTDGYILSKDKQIKAIVEWAQNNVSELESSDMVKLLEKNYPSSK